MKLIGIVSQVEVVNGREFETVNNTYINALKAFGAMAIIIPATINMEMAEKYLDIVSGVLFTGGRDISPQSYNQKSIINYISDPNIQPRSPYSINNAPNIKQDEFELKLYKRAKEKKLNILGVCRGMQLINVAEGGTLIQHIEDNDVQHFVKEDGWIHYHDVKIQRDSKAFKLINKEIMGMSSLHHQGIDTLGENLQGVAYSPDGIVEIIESKDESFIMGVQGHIEVTYKNFPEHGEIFKGLLI
ncbi:MAG: gamma-glutamyl-gamma-aminobutyrate hydrolase family protein [Lachnospirales bacterium]